MVVAGRTSDLNSLLSSNKGRKLHDDPAQGLIIQSINESIKSKYHGDIPSYTYTMTVPLIKVRHFLSLLPSLPSSAQ